MKRTWIVSAAMVLLCFTSAVQAQFGPEVVTEVNLDRTVTFRLKAPAASDANVFFANGSKPNGRRDRTHVHKGTGGGDHSMFVWRPALRDFAAALTQDFRARKWCVHRR